MEEDEGYHEWYNNNEKELMSDFVDDNPDEWEEFLEMKRATLEQDDFDYWKVLFCKEEMEEDFQNYCEDEYGNCKDIIQTDNAIWNARYSMKGGEY